MKPQKLHNNLVHLYMAEIGCRIVAKTGIPSDRFHLGKLILASFKESPQLIMQIDGGTGESITFQTALEKSVYCATAFRTLGLKTNDAIIIMAPNHNDVTLPMYAGFYLGITVCGTDATLGIKELQDTFKSITPKIIFCQTEKAGHVEHALREINLDSKIVTFNNGAVHLTFSEFLQKYGGNEPVENFEPDDFDTEETIGILAATSGTTGASKYPALTHKCLTTSFPYMWTLFSKFPRPIENAIVLSPIQWLSASCHFVISPIFKYTRVQTSSPLTTEHICHLINKYRPSYSIVSPTLISVLMKPENRNKCDLSCFELLLVGGFAVPQILFDDVKKVTPEIDIRISYGMSEIGCFGFNAVADIPGSCGKPLGHLHYRLVDPITKEDILEPNKTGELWLKSFIPFKWSDLDLKVANVHYITSMRIKNIDFKGYYNNPQATAETITEDGWMKTGDLFYRDVNWNFFFVDRLKMLLKYCSHHISPTEIENVIIKHPGILQVAVTGIVDEEFGDLPVACVVPQDNYTLTAQEIKDMVKKSLVDTKQLRGGVIFMKELPLTPTLKVNRVLLKKMVKDMERE